MGKVGRTSCGFELDSVSVRKAKEFVGHAFGEGWEKVERFKSEKISYSTMAAYNAGSFMSREGKWRIFSFWLGMRHM